MIESKPSTTMTKLYPPRLFYCKNPLFHTEQNDIMEMRSLFEKAVAEAMLMTARPDNERLLQLYSLYKQATKGDIDIAPPQNPSDYTARAKYDAWASLKGKSIKQAQQEYICLVNNLRKLV